MIMLIWSIQPIYAQQPVDSPKGTVTGMIRDTAGNAIPFATVRIKGKAVAAKTGKSGSFTLTAPTGPQVLQASYVGFENQEKDVLVKENQSQTVDFVLEKSSAELDEIIVSASRRVEYLSETPSSVTVLSSKDIEELSTVSPNLGNMLGYAIVTGARLTRMEKRFLPI